MSVAGDEGDELPSETNAAFSERLRQFSYKHVPDPTANRKIEGEKPVLRIPSSNKRKFKDYGEEPTVTSFSSPLKRRTTPKERSVNDPHSPPNKLIDSLRPGLTLVFIGLNPGLETARTGHAYAHPTNHFWPLLHKSGITSIRHKAADTHALLDLYGIGNTNLCSRPTRSGDGLSKQEQIDGAKIVEEKVARFRPAAVCIVGKGIWDVIYKAKTGKTLKRADFEYGWQDEEFWLGREECGDGEVRWEGSRTFVSTSTSGLAAATKPAEKLAVMEVLGEWVKRRRKDSAEKKEEEACMVELSPRMKQEVAME